MVAPTVSVIIDQISPCDEQLLLESLFSLALVETPLLELNFICTQSAIDPLEVVARYPFRNPPVCRRLDSRQKLSDLVKQCSAEHVAFMRSDEVLYQFSYQELSSCLARTSLPLAVGSFRLAAVVRAASGSLFIESKETVPNPDLDTVARYNLDQLPLSAFLYRKTALLSLASFDLMPGAAMAPNLVRASLSYPQPAYDLSGTPVCEKRVFVE